MDTGQHRYNGAYSGEYLNHVAFPLGGIGAGMVCLAGSGALTHVSLRHRPELFHEPLLLGALCIQGEPNAARVLEGPVPAWKTFFPWGGKSGGAGEGAAGKSYGLPRFASAEFQARFPFATVRLDDAALPLAVELTGWSPFVPGDADNSSLPVAALEYRFANHTSHPVKAVFSFHAENFMAQGTAGQAVRPSEAGFVLWQAGLECPCHQGAFSVEVDHPDARVHCAWFRGGWFDALTMLWKTVAAGESPAAGPYSAGDPSPGGSLYVPLLLKPGEEQTLALRLAWHVPHSDLRSGAQGDTGQAEACEGPPQGETYAPWYAGRFGDIAAVNAYWRANYASLRQRSMAFAECFYNTTLPAEVIEAVAANLSILKSPTLLRQADGRLWCWEGCSDQAGCCAGSCTHVWNYAQALAHLFPELERSLRKSEFHDGQDERGHQNFRAALPIRPTREHTFHAAADGQLGGVMKVFRDWRISGDTAWLAALWPRVQKSLAYCIATWDPRHRGALEEPHHNTYDVEFWGADGMGTSFYLGALAAACVMGQVLGQDTSLYRTLLARGQQVMREELFAGEYFVQQVRWQGLQAPDPATAARHSLSTSYSPEALALLEQEGPKYQYGQGCLADGIVGAWLGAVCGLPSFLEPQQVESHLLAVYRYNFFADLSHHSNPQRSTYALGREGGLVLCTWPHGAAPSLPFPYSDEVWTGIEYQVAGHLMLLGHVAEGLEIVRTARARYDGRVRNPFDEYECGHWYARALSSYALLQALTGIRYDAVERTLYIHPRVPGDFRAFLCVATGYATVGVRDGLPFVEVRQGTIPYQQIAYEPYPDGAGR